MDAGLDAKAQNPRNRRAAGNALIRTGGAGKRIDRTGQVGKRRRVDYIMVMVTGFCSWRQVQVCVRLAKKGGRWGSRENESSFLAAAVSRLFRR